MTTRTEQRSMQCTWLQCANRTLDYSGRCHLHRTPTPWNPAPLSTLLPTLPKSLFQVGERPATIAMSTIILTGAEPEAIEAISRTMQSGEYNWSWDLQAPDTLCLRRDQKSAPLVTVRLDPQGNASRTQVVQSIGFWQSHSDDYAMAERMGTLIRFDPTSIVAPMKAPSATHRPVLGLNSDFGPVRGMMWGVTTTGMFRSYIDSFAQAQDIADIDPESDDPCVWPAETEMFTSEVFPRRYAEPGDLMVWVRRAW